MKEYYESGHFMLLIYVDKPHVTMRRLTTTKLGIVFYYFQGKLYF